MTATSNAKPLELTVSNFGPIAEAGIELRPMSVFVGPSNTGKSYMAALIYVLHRFFNGYSANAKYNSAHGAQSLVKKFGLAGMQQMLLKFETAPSSSYRNQLQVWFANLSTMSHSWAKFWIAKSEDVSGTGKAENLIRYSSGRRPIFLAWHQRDRTGRSDPFEYNVGVKRETELKASVPGTMPMRIERENMAHPAANFIFSPEGLKEVSTEDTEEHVMTWLIRTCASACIPGILGPLARPRPLPSRGPRRRHARPSSGSTRLDSKRVPHRAATRIAGAGTLRSPRRFHGAACRLGGFIAAGAG